MWHDPLTWTVVSIIVYAITTNIHWASHASRRRPGRLADLVAWCDAPRHALVARGAYLFGMPAAAVLLRVATPTQLGLVAPRTATSVAIAVAGAALAITLVAWSRLSLARSTGAEWALRPSPMTVKRLGELLLGALLLEAHWALFRAGGLSAVGGALTAGVFLGVAFLATEAWSNPWRRIAFRDPRSVHELSVGAVLALTSALTFLVTGSSVVALALHIVVAAVLAWSPPAAAIVGEPRRADAAQGSQAPTTEA